MVRRSSKQFISFKPDNDDDIDFDDNSPPVDRFVETIPGSNATPPLPRDEANEGCYIGMSDVTLEQPDEILSEEEEDEIIPENFARYKRPEYSSTDSRRKLLSKIIDSPDFSIARRKHPHRRIESTEKQYSTSKLTRPTTPSSKRERPPKTVRPLALQKTRSIKDLDHSPKIDTPSNDTVNDDDPTILHQNTSTNQYHFLNLDEKPENVDDIAAKYLFDTETVATEGSYDDEYFFSWFHKRETNLHKRRLFCACVVGSVVMMSAVGMFLGSIMVWREGRTVFSPGGRHSVGGRGGGGLTMEEVRGMVLGISPVLENGGDASTPQYRALSWVVASRELVDGLSEERIVQRYVLGTFFFSTDGIEWKRGRNWLSDENECDWSGVKCFEDRVIALELNEMGLKGSIPVEIGGLEQLEELHLPNNAINNQITHSIFKSTKLRKLDLSNNQLSGEIPINIGSMSSLEYVDLSYNRIRGLIPFSIGHLEFLKYLDLGNNVLKEEIPNEIMGLKHLETLILDNNNLEGGIDNRIDGMESLKILQVTGNEFFGSIPAGIGKLTNLVKLHLDNNAFHGSIPIAMKNLVQLRNLILSKNMLTGSIPDSLVSLKYLEKLHLERNQLEGQVPEWLSELISLEEIKLEGNSFEGTISQHICDLNFDVLSSDCDGDPPNVSCSCCTKCFAT